MPLELKKKLIDSGVVTSEEVRSAEQVDQQSQKGIIHALLDMEEIDHEVLLYEIAKIYQVDYIDITELRVDDELLARCPESLCLTYKFIPVSKSKQEMVIATGDPFNVEMLDDLAFKLNMHIVPKFTRPDFIVKRIAELFQNGEAAFDISLEEMNEEIALTQEFESTDEVANLDELRRGAEDSPIINLVNRIIIQAMKIESSDIHIEAGERQSVVRMRIDGLLRIIMKFPIKAHALVVSRIKIMSRLDISNARTPQDGRIHINLWGKRYDIRTSTLPSMYGEKVVMRILDKGGVGLGLNSLGFDKLASERVYECIKRTTGAVLVTGPTGSGKTTTLYSFLHHIRDETLNIVTVEDPIEYQVEGINHVPVNVKSGMSFSKVLRSILRQDPDVVMVGEIRDEETAQIAMHAAQTGHLVFSTLHTNDASSTIDRLVDLGVEPFVLSSSLNLIVAQRLVRRLCPVCKKQSYPDEKVSKQLDIPPKVTFYEKVGCSDCMETGYKGRVAIFEVMYVDDQLRQLIADGAGAQQVMKAARESDMFTLFEDAFSKALAGHTSLEEVLRICATPEKFSMREQVDEQYQLMPLGQSQQYRNQEHIEAENKTGERTILIVDDSSDLRKLVEMLLQMEGYKVIQAEDGQQAWDILQKLKPSLVLSDVEMPNMSGIELLQYVREESRFNDMPFVMLTSHKEEEEQVLGLNIGADDYIGKPVEPLNLQARIRRILTLYDHLHND